MDKEKPQKQTKQRLTDYGKYSSLAFQMGITIALGVWGGIKLDEYFPLGRFPLFTIGLSLFSVFAAMYFAIRTVSKK